MDYKGFKNELNNYYRHLRNVDRIKEEIDDIVYEMTGVKGIRYDKERSSFNPALSEERRDYLSKKLEEKEIELNYTLAAIRFIEMNLKKLNKDDREMCLKVVADEVSAELVAVEKGYSRSGVWARIRREISKIL